MSTEPEKFYADDGRIVDHLLGEGSAEERAGFRRELEADPTAAVEFAATKLLLDELRELGTEVAPSAAFGARVRSLRLQQRRSLERRARRREPNPWPVLWAAAAVLLITLGVRLFPQPAARTSGEVQSVDLEALPPKLPRLESEDAGVIVVAEGGAAAWATEIEGVPTELPVPVEQDRQFHEMVARLAQNYPAPDTFSQWVSADNQLAVLRLEFRNRFTPTARKRALALTGGRPELEGRVQALAATVADRIDADLQSGTASVRDTALALRALLASGSDTRMGRHRAVARRCAAWLEARVSAGGDNPLSDEDSAIALAALSDMAVCVGRYGELVRSGVEALAVRTVSAADGGRPGLLHWRVSPHALGDAGRVFRLAPAFGVRTSLAYRARMLVAAHMEERLAAGRDDRPELLAAQRYGFDDLVDRDSLDQKLRLWRASYLKPDYVAMHHLAWSQYPVRPGWARFQRELRGLATLATPEAVGDASALLLCLAMNFAAPGVSELVGSDR